MEYQLWDVESGNQVASFDSESGGLDAVNRLLGSHGREYVECLALARVAKRGTTSTIAAGADLVARAAEAKRRQPVA